MMTDEKLDEMMKVCCDRDTEVFVFRQRKNRGWKIASAFAVALALTAVISALLFYRDDGGTNDCRYTVTAYSYRPEKLLQLCESDLNVQTVGNKSFETVPEELSERVGAGITGVVYADAAKVVFTTGRGVFVYDYRERQMMLTVDLDAIGVPGFNQGDISTHIQVDRGGGYAILTSSNDWSRGKNFEYRVLDLVGGEIRAISKKDIPEDFSPAEREPWPEKYYPKNPSDPANRLPNSWPSEIMASYVDSEGKTVDFYTNIERSVDGRVIVGNMELVIVSPGYSFTTQRVFASLYPQYQRQEEE